MKNISLICMLFFVQYLFPQAQIGWHATAGGTYTQLNSDDLLAEGGAGYRAGIVMTLGYHETYNWQFEAMYNSGSVNVLTSDANFEKADNTKFNYNGVEIGFYLNYYLLIPEEDEFYLGAQLGGSAIFGPELSPVDNSSDNFYLPYRLQENNLEMTKLNYSAGAGFTGGYNNFRFDLRYNHGLNNILSESKTNSYDEFNRYTGPSLKGTISSVSFSVGYKFL